MTDQEREDELRTNQDGRVYPLGRALRATFDTDNHESLSSDVTGLMIDLSKVPYGPDEAVSLAAMSASAPGARRPLGSDTAERSWRARLGVLFGRRRYTT